MKRMKRPSSRGGGAEEKKFPPRGDTPAQDTDAVMSFYGIKDSFPADARAEAARAGALMQMPGARLDLRKEFVFTCDPASARDYDDALSVKRGRGGVTTLGVHIADVSHFVPEGGALDREAARRSTSVYFADRVVPMLPHELSDDLCSLVPGEDRLAFSVFMDFDSAGHMTGRRFAKSVIRSKGRFTYEQVMKTIAGGAKGPADAAAGGRKGRDAIIAIHSLAAKLRRRRFAECALDLELPEAKISLDAFGELSSVELRAYDESHQMVEECMVAANEAVAAELWGNGIKILARLHEPPDPEKLEMLRADLASAGVECGDLLSRKAFSRMTDAIKKSPIYPTLAMMVLRSMKRAVYDGGTIGHWGLAKRFYAHFTSPIRRYPDLTVHRQLAAYLAGRPCRVPSAALAKAAKHATEAEERAAEAERALAEIKKYRVLDAQSRMRNPPTYAATISRCLPPGCFVEVPDLAVSGFVRAFRLPGGYARFDATTGSMRSRSGHEWKPGDALKVRAASVDWRFRRLDFAPVRD